MIGYLKSHDSNVNLFYRLDSTLNPKGNVVINHGFAEHLGRYDYLTDKLRQAGYNVLRYDLRGHGQTKSKKGYIESYQKFIEDADLMVDFMIDHHPEVPIFMLGHSMGGFVTSLYGLTHPEKLSGQIFSGAANGVLPILNNGVDNIIKKLAKVTPKLLFPNIVDDKICSDQAVVEAYKKDPNVLKSATINFYNEFLNKGVHVVLDDMNTYDLPCLILHGQKDSIVPNTISIDFYQQINSEDKELVIYSGLYHEILNELKKDDILNTIIIWLDERA